MGAERRLGSRERRGESDGPPVSPRDPTPVAIAGGPAGVCNPG